MKWSTVFSAFLALALLIGSTAEAGRLGGGRSIGRQSSNVMQRANPAVRPAAPAVAPPAAPVPAKRPWGAMLGGLAAGLGLAWLASSLGLGGAMGNILMVALLVMVAMFVIRLLMRRFASAAPMAYQNARDSGGYSPANVGNDASARPWERSGNMPLESAAGGSMIGAALQGSQSWGVPAGFDTNGFLSACKTNFITLQGAWDRADINALRALMTDEMLAQTQVQLADASTHSGVGQNKTEVVMIEAQLLGIEETAGDYMASVEFSGMLREDPHAGPTPFREVWNMTKLKNGGGWLVAGIQAL